MQEPVEGYHLHDSVAPIAFESKSGSQKEQAPKNDEPPGSKQPTSGEQSDKAKEEAEKRDLEKRIKMKYNEMLFNSSASSLRGGALPQNVSIVAISPPALHERNIPLAAYAARHNFIMDSSQTIDASTLSEQKPVQLPAMQRRASEISTDAGNPVESASSSHIHHNVQEIMGTVTSASSHYQTGAAQPNSGGKIFASTWSTHLREPSSIPPPPPCTHAPLLVLLRQHAAEVQPLGLQHYCTEGTVEGITEIKLQASQESLHALAIKRGENILSLPDADLALLGRHLPSAHSCTALSFLSCAMRPVALCTLVAKLHQVCRLTVCNCNLDAESFVCLLAALPLGLLSLNVSFNDLGKVGKSSAATRLKNKLFESSSMGRRSGPRSFASNTDSIASELDLTHLARLTSLQELLLRRCGLSGTSMIVLSPNIAVLSSLTSVDFSFNPMGKSGTRAAVSALAASGAPVSVLRLDGVKSPNRSFSAGLQGILAALGPNIPATLHTLSFSECNLECNAAVALANFLCSAPRLRSLDLSRNSVGARGASKLTAKLAQCGDIRALSLGHNNIGNTGTCAILENLSPCQHLEVLNLEAVGLTGASIPTFTQLIPQFKCLQELLLGWNSIMDDGIRQLLPALQQLPLLRELHLPSTGLQWGGAQALVAAVPQLEALRVLDVQYNTPGGGGHALLSQLECSRPDLVVHRW
jgi:hypothetical protein